MLPLSVAPVVCVWVWHDGLNVCLMWSFSLYMFVCLWTLCCLFCTFLSCLCLVMSPGSTLSAQSLPTMHPGPLTLLAPGGLADSCSNTLLQPLKPCPSSSNLCSAYTSEGALSVPSLCAPTPGRHVADICSLYNKSTASVQTQMRAFWSLTLYNKTPQTPCLYLSPSLSLSLTFTLFLCIPSLVSLSFLLISALFLIIYLSILPSPLP